MNACSRAALDAVDVFRTIQFPTKIDMVRPVHLDDIDDRHVVCFCRLNHRYRPVDQLFLTTHVGDTTRSRIVRVGAAHNIYDNQNGVTFNE